MYGDSEGAGIVDVQAGAQMLLTRLVAPFADLLDQRNLLSYIGTLLFVGLAVIAIRLARPRGQLRLRALARLLFRRSVWLHPSARLDYRMYLLNLPVLAFILGGFVISSTVWAKLAGDGLSALFGPPPAVAGAHWSVAGAATLVQFLAFDFGYWLGHAVQHRSAFLWEFHKVHHSALVMTPATEYRQHPVELTLMPSVIGLTTGIAYAVTARFTGGGAGHFGFNLIILGHLLTFHHLRHSHIDMAFTGIWGRLLHSPAHHRIHHSADPAHFDRNMGYILSVWDWMAGTLVVPRRGERLTLGIGPEGLAHDSVGRALWLPVRKAWQLLIRREVTGRARL